MEELYQFVRRIERREAPRADDRERGFPFTIPAVEHLRTLSFHPKLTLFAGENGSGKSTLLEAVADLAGFAAQGGTKSFMLDDEPGASGLSAHLKLIRGAKRERGGFFLRAESFFNVVSEVDRLGVAGYGDRSLHHRSHGESFIALVENRFGRDNLLILDEPEAALSPKRQLTFLAMMHDLLQVGCQLIVATHSPILLAYPDAQIYWVGEDGITPREYQDLEHVTVTRDFLNAPELFLKHLLSE